MTSEERFSMSFILSVLLINLEIVRTIKTDIYCDYSKHESYLPQGDFCKRCDRCPPGFGLEQLKDRKVEFDPVHGALECRRCVVCTNGCFSHSRSFKECKLCRNCTSEGRVELRQCTETSNAKCGNILPDISRQVKGKDLLKSEVVHVPNTEDGNEIVYVLAAVIALLIVTMVTTISLLYNHRKRLGVCKRKLVIDKNIIYSKGHIERANTEQNRMLVPKYNDNSVICDLEEDCEKISFPVLEIWKKKHGHNESLDDEHILFLSKLIATDNTFQKLGIQLGIPENEIAIIKTDHSGDVSNQAYYTLHKWRTLKGKSAFVLVILNELHELERNDIIEKFCSAHR
ncbi:uncharacterized protein LOC127716493 isoform X1 [Mytilus californianus]|uniref:uncharacterized protein LOC127716493 isoform X1 n=2 Tax=Mytilus californianus TaxID=6549 RepID=UPI002247E41E|nr:uncharacterized protein LOC127716493 isoform X1 [Mytilus californianus]